MTNNADSASRRWNMLVKAGLISALGCMLVLMLPVITLEKGTNVALGEAIREITEFAGLDIADEAARNWNPAAELVECTV